LDLGRIKIRYEMIIEIRKAGFSNKGAELMLLATLEILKNEFPDAKFCMTPVLSSKPYEKRIALGLYQKIHLRDKKRGKLFGVLGNIIPKRIRDMYGIVIDGEVDAVIDISGYSYHDRWQTSSCTQLAMLSKAWKRNGTKVILLPQAFGPFETIVSSDAMIAALKNIDLIFAREQESFDHLVKLGGRTDHIKIAPDFTNLLEGVPPEDDDCYSDYCIIPNFRMIQKSPEKDRALYKPFIVKCIQRLQVHGHTPFLLIHEMGQDEVLADEINSMLSTPLRVLKETDPLRIKGIIGCCEGVIASRYHGLVSALSQGVPALATSWSHKYQLLFDDYGIKDGLRDLHSGDEELYQQIDRIVDPTSKNRIKATLNEKSAELKQKSLDMWKDVFDCLHTIKA